MARVSFYQNYLENNKQTKPKHQNHKTTHTLNNKKKKKNTTHLRYIMQCNFWVLPLTGWVGFGWLFLSVPFFFF